MKKVIKSRTISTKRKLIIGSIILVSPYCLRLDSMQAILTLLVKI